MDVMRMESLLTSKRPAFRSPSPELKFLVDASSFASTLAARASSSLAVFAKLYRKTLCSSAYEVSKVFGADLPPIVILDCLSAFDDEKYMEPRLFPLR